MVRNNKLPTGRTLRGNTFKPIKLRLTKRPIFRLLGRTFANIGITMHIQNNE